MTKTEFQKKLSEFRIKKQKLINDTYLWATLAIKSLTIIGENDEIVEEMSKFNVPSTVKGKIVRRTPEDVKKIINNATEKELYYTLFTYIVAQFESFLIDIISLVLKYDKRKMRINCQGGDNNKKVDFSELLDCESYENMIDLLIEKQLGALFYAGPKKQIEYIEKVLNIELDEDKWNKWIEYKATRDIVVHNSGIINKIYIEKVGSSARGVVGDEIVINKTYFENLLVLTKSMVGSMVTQAKKIVV